MSELASVLELFGFLSIDEVTVDSLKKSFKTRILQAHPDKGGDDIVFDKMLRSYVYLTETLQRISGGRATLQNIVSPDELKEIEKVVRKREANFTFSKANIPLGSVLYFCKNEEITCTVFSENTVLFNSEELTLTEAARKTGLILQKEIQGPKYWCYEDETLTNRRKRFQDY